ncbi:uncharacterized protein B4U80_12228, partial [Leptotrombidium deliense]
NKACAIISDNAANMHKMRDIIKQKYQNIEVIGCAAHGLNLLVKDIASVEKFNSIISSTKTIVNEINNSAVKLAKFDFLREGKCNRLCTYTTIRWNSLKNMLQSVLNARDVIGMLALNNDITNQDNLKLILNSSGLFWKDIADLIAKINPISTAINEVQNDKSIVSKIPKFPLNYDQVSKT